MRLLFSIVLISLVVALVWFGVSNAGTDVSVKLGSRVFETRVSILVAISVVLGVVVAFVIALAEGARIRFENRRLAREVRQLETEIHYLRTQPAASVAPESESAEPRVERPVVRKTALAAPGSGASPPASAPVYGDDEEDWTDPQPYRNDEASS